MILSDQIELAANLGWLNVELEYGLEPLRPRTLTNPASGGVIPTRLYIEGTTVEIEAFPELTEHLIQKAWSEHYG